MQIEGVNVTVKSNQALIVKNYCRHCDKFYSELLGEDKEKQEARWRIITQVSNIVIIYNVTFVWKVLTVKTVITITIISDINSHKCLCYLK